MTERRDPRTARRRTGRVRGVGIFAAVVGFLAYINLAEASNQQDRAFREVTYVTRSELETAVASRAATPAFHSILEYGAMVLTGVGIVVAVFGPSISRQVQRDVASVRRAPSPAGGEMPATEVHDAGGSRLAPTNHLG